jgi:phosphoesterase RecJ-like protein
MELVDDGRLAVMHLDDEMLQSTGSTHNDTEGLINLPLTAREIQAVVFFKIGNDEQVRVSMRSKYDVDVRQVAAAYGGGGHKNAAGFTASGKVADVKDEIIGRMVEAIRSGLQSRPL